MAQLPASMRRKRAAITSIHDKPPTPKEKLTNFGGWVFLLVALVVLACGIFGLYNVMTHAETAELKAAGTRSAAEESQVMQHIAPLMSYNYYSSDLEKIRALTCVLFSVELVVV